MCRITYTKIGLVNWYKVQQTGQSCVLLLFTSGLFIFLVVMWYDFGGKKCQYHRFWICGLHTLVGKLWMKISKTCVGEYVCQFVWQIRFNYYCYQNKLFEPKQGSLHSPRYAHLLIVLGGKLSFVSIDIFLFWFSGWTCLIFLYNYMDCHYYNLKVSFFTFLY